MNDAELESLVGKKRCINCGRADGTVGRPSYQCDLCWNAVCKALGARRKAESRLERLKREGRK